MKRKIYRDDIPPEVRVAYHQSEWFPLHSIRHLSFLQMERTFYKWYDSLPPEIISILGNGELRTLVDENVSRLDYLQQRVVRLRLGLEYGKIRSLDEIGRELLVTHLKKKKLSANPMTRGTVVYHYSNALNRLSHRSMTSKVNNYVNKHTHQTEVKLYS